MATCGYGPDCYGTMVGIGTTLVYRGYHPLRNGDSYQYDLTWVPTGLPVLVYWDEPRRSTYHFTSGVRIRLVRPRCRGNRHEPQPAAQARPIERACSKTVGGRRLDHFSRSSLVTGTGRFGVSSSRSLLPTLPSHQRHSIWGIYVLFACYTCSLFICTA